MERPKAEVCVPAETKRVAEAVFRGKNRYIAAFDKMTQLFSDEQFDHLYSHRGQPGFSPARLSIVTILQFCEGLSDRDAVDAVRSRIDWKYVLCLELEHPGFDSSVLSEFRTRLVEGGAESLLFDTVLQFMIGEGVVKTKGTQRTDSTHILAAVRGLNTLERVVETMRHALNALAHTDPDWLRAMAPSEWYERYNRIGDNYHLPKKEPARDALLMQVGSDGLLLLDELTKLSLPEVDEVTILRRVWSQLFERTEEGDIRLIPVEKRPPAQERISSPHDPEARYSKKRDVRWTGYKVHLTETCDPEGVNTIINVHTTPSIVPDDRMLGVIHEQLSTRALLPKQHLVDRGYVNSRSLLESQENYDVEVIGEVSIPVMWQDKNAGQGKFQADNFTVDWEKKQAVCPNGEVSKSWRDRNYEIHGYYVEVKFERWTCLDCKDRPLCTRSDFEPRELRLQTEKLYKIRQQRKKEQTSIEFKKKYAARSGIEGTHSQAVRTCGARRSRYIGHKKTHLQNLLVASAINVLRFGNWALGVKRSTTRISPFCSLRDEFDPLQPLAA